MGMVAAAETAFVFAGAALVSGARTAAAGTAIAGWLTGADEGDIGAGATGSTTAAAGAAGGTAIGAGATGGGAIGAGTGTLASEGAVAGLLWAVSARGAGAFVATVSPGVGLIESPGEWIAFVGHGRSPVCVRADCWNRSAPVNARMNGFNFIDV